MRDDLGGLRRSLESSVDQPAFDALAQRADAVGRRRRTRRAALAASVAVVAIVFAAVLVAGPGGTESEYAGRPGGTEPSATASPDDRAEGEVLTYAYRPSGSRPVRVLVQKKLFGSAGPKEAAVELNAATTAGQAKRVEYFAFAERTVSGDWEAIYSYGTAAPQCRGLHVRQTGTGTLFELPRRCLPARGSASRWTAMGPPSAGLRSVEFVVTPVGRADPDSEP